MALAAVAALVWLGLKWSRDRASGPELGKALAAPHVRLLCAARGGSVLALTTSASTPANAADLVVVDARSGPALVRMRSRCEQRPLAPWVALSPDGGTLVTWGPTIDCGPVVCAVRVDDAQLLWSRPVEDEALLWGLSVSPDGQYVAVDTLDLRSRKRILAVQRLSDGHPVCQGNVAWAASSPPRAVGWASWGALSDEVFLPGTEELTCVAVPSGTVRQCGSIPPALRTAAAPVYLSAASTGGLWVASASEPSVAGPHQQRVAVVVASDKPSVRYGPALLGDPLWLPESRLVLYRASSGSEEPGDLMALDTDTGASRRLLGQVADFVPCAGSAWVIHTGQTARGSWVCWRLVAGRSASSLHLQTASQGRRARRRATTRAESRQSRSRAARR